jgi:hypothetical protein
MDGLNYTIEVDDQPARQATDRVNKAFDGVGQHAASNSTVAAGAFASMTAAIIANGRTIEQSFIAAGHAIAGFGGFVVKAAEAGVAMFGAYTLVTGAIAKYGATAESSTSFTESLVNSFRALRLAASAAIPEIFGSLAVSATTVGIGILAEEVIRLTAARGKLIEQQALFSAVNQLPIGAVERADLQSRISGSNSASVRTLAVALDNRIDNSQSDVRSGLNTLGVPGYLGKPGEVVDPQLLGAIASGFASIEDPAKRAAAAVAIFGKDNASTALQELTPQFANASGAIERFGGTLDEASRNQIFAFRQDLSAIRAWFADFSDFATFGHQLGNLFESGTAKAEQFFKRSLIGFDNLTARIPGAQALRQFGSGPSDQQFNDEAYLILKDKLGRSGLDATDKATADQLVKEAYATQFFRDSSPEGQQARLSAANSARDRSLAALKSDDALRSVRPNDPAVLSTSARLATATAATSAAQLAATLDEQIKAAKAATEVSKHQSEALRSSEETLYRSTFEPGAGKDLRGEIRKDTTFVDDKGQIQQFRLLDSTRRNLEAAFSVYALDLLHKSATEHIKLENEVYQQREKFEDQIYQKRQTYERQTLEAALASDDKVFAHQNDLAGYSRDEQIGSLNIDRPQTVRGQVALEQRKLAIEQQYLLTTASNNADAVTRDRDRKLTEAASARFSNQITDKAYFDRVKQVQDTAGVEGTAISDKYTHDSIAAQQAAAAASVQIVRSAQEKEFDSLKSSVEGVLNAMETKGTGVFQAIANSAKVAFLGAFNQILSSQIAASLFRVLNPGQSVEFDTSGQGKGPFGGILGGLGLGTRPTFGGGLPDLKISTDTNTGATDRNTDALDRNTAARTGGGSPAPAPIGGFNPFAGASRLGALALLGSGLAFAGPQLIDRTASAGASGGSVIDGTVNYDGGGSENFSSFQAGASYGSESLGIPGGYGLSLPGMGGNDPGISGRGNNPIFGGIFGGGKGGGLFSKGGLSKSLSNFDMNFLNGAFHPGNTVGLAGNLSQLGHSPAALLGGGLLVADGLKRGGTVGTIEDTAGGALIGFKYGGPIGAAIGAGIGLGAGLIRQFFFGGDRQHTKDLVKQIYGISINDGMADQIIQLAKQSYGGEISVAVRSQQVRDLLKLYAESIGSSAQKQFVNDTIHGASLVEAGGKLTQGAVYDNGQAYTYQSGLPTLGGISSSILPTVARTAGSINVGSLQLSLNGQAASDVLAGQVGRIATPSYVQGKSIAAQQSSIGRSSATTLALAPSAIVQ